MSKAKKTPWWDKLLTITILCVMFALIWPLMPDSRSKVSYTNTNSGYSETRYFHFNETYRSFAYINDNRTRIDDLYGTLPAEKDYETSKDNFVAAWFLDRLLERQPNIEYQAQLEHREVDAVVFFKKDKGTTPTQSCISFISKILNQMKNASASSEGVSFRMELIANH